MRHLTVQRAIVRGLPDGLDAIVATGHALIRNLVEQHRVPLTICGHTHWDEALAQHSAGQILNVDTRVVVLVAQSRP